jgi:hypothetical protein
MIIQTGSASSILALAVGIGFFFEQLSQGMYILRCNAETEPYPCIHSQVSAALTYALGSTYVLTMIYSLNYRESEKHRDNTHWQTVVFSDQEVDIASVSGSGVGLRSGVRESHHSCNVIDTNSRIRQRYPPQRPPQ